MIRVAAAGAGIALALAFPMVAAQADQVAVLSKKAWKQGNASGNWIIYRHDGKKGKAKVSCRYGFRPVYTVDGLDRGDGVKINMDVGSSDGSTIAGAVAPLYMNWAIDIWKQTCR